MKDEWLENLAAAVSAQGYVLEVLLTRHLKQFLPGGIREEYADSLLANGVRTDAIRAMGLELADAVQLSDVVVKTHEQLADMIGRAMTRAEASDPASAQGPPVPPSPRPD